MKMYLDENLVATVQFSKGATTSIDYEPEWIRNGFSLAPSLSFRRKTEKLAPDNFIRNYFPEGSAFELILEYFRISRANTHALLQCLGNDLPGALRFASDENENTTPAQIREISLGEMKHRIENRHKENIVFWDEKPRLSLAGYQDKLNVFWDQESNTLGLPIGTASSTHILKFQSLSDPTLVLNEHLMLELAASVGIKTCKSKVVDFGNQRCLAVERFDRKIKADRVQYEIFKSTFSSETTNPQDEPKIESATKLLPEVYRVHVIDACQALGLSPDQKYERSFGDGPDVKGIRTGVSFADLTELCNFSLDDQQQRNQLLDWAIFNLVIDNFDAHGKNASFFVDKDGISFAPFYDLVCVGVYPNFSNTRAMGIGGNFNEEPLTKDNLIEFAEDLRIPYESVIERIKSLAEAIAKETPKLFCHVKEKIHSISDDEQDFLVKCEQHVRSKAIDLADFSDQLLHAKKDCPP